MPQKETGTLCESYTRVGQFHRKTSKMCFIKGNDENGAQLPRK